MSVERIWSACVLTVPSLYMSLASCSCACVGVCPSVSFAWSACVCVCVAALPPRPQAVAPVAAVRGVCVRVDGVAPSLLQSSLREALLIAGCVVYVDYPGAKRAHDLFVAKEAAGKGCVSPPSTPNCTHTIHVHIEKHKTHTRPQYACLCDDCVCVNADWVWML